jgi:opacity protein-like surface antigen
LLITTFALATVGGQPVLAQTVDSQVTKKKFTTSTDLSVGVFGQLTPARTPVTTTNQSGGSQIFQTTQGTSPSPGVLGTFHQSFRPWLGYNVNVGYTRFSENYSSGYAFVPNASSTFPAFSNFSQGSIGTNMYEVTVAYAIQGPRAKRFNTFAQFGGGGLFFLPTQSSSPYDKQTRPAMLFGVGVNYKLSAHWGIRAEYRGLFYKNPDFAYYSGNAVPISKLFTVTNTPGVSVVYSFGTGKKK